MKRASPPPRHLGGYGCLSPPAPFSSHGEKMRPMREHGEVSTRSGHRHLVLVTGFSKGAFVTMNYMKPISILALCLALVVQEFRALAQLPHIMTYQGRVASGGTNFSGTGQFKFALVSGGTSAAAQASASATVFFGFVVQIAVTSGGAGYATAPAVTIADSAGSGASAIAQIANGQVTGITVTDAGSGYSASPTITIAPPTVNLSYTTYWSHDGTSSAGGEPASAVPVSVAQGLFTVGLGDTLIPSMSALPPQVLANPDVRLRMWFNDGVNGFSQLSPDQRLTSTAYAMMADTVRDGAITAGKLAPNSITSAQIAPGSITSSQLADGAVTRAKLAVNVNLGPPRGSVVMSADANDTNLIAAGYARMPGARVQTEEWQTLNSPTAIPGLQESSAVWTGTEMIVWGSVENGYATGGGRYNPSNNSWVPIPTNGPPAAGFGHYAIWTGSEMILWGVEPPSGSGVYNPQSNSWRALNLDNAPGHVRGATVVWTGTEMIVWNGPVKSGGRYNPVTDQWSPVSTIGSPPPDPTLSVWSGTEMIVWNQNTSSGGRYNPASNTWRPISTNGSPRSCVSAVWTGMEMFVIGQSGRESFGIYHPGTDSWRSVSRVPIGHSAVFGAWTGTRVVVLVQTEVLGVWFYNLAGDSWEMLSTAGAPGGSDGYDHASVWTGNELLVYGDYLQSGQVYRAAPSPTLYLYQKQ